MPIEQFLTALAVMVAWAFIVMFFYLYLQVRRLPARTLTAPAEFADVGDYWLQVTKRVVRITVFGNEAVDAGYVRAW